jgi:hypothetical protein
MLSSSQHMYVEFAELRMCNGAVGRPPNFTHDCHNAIMLDDNGRIVHAISN